MKKVSLFSTPAHLLTYMEFYQFISSQANRIHDLGDTVLADVELKQLVAVLLTLSGDFNKVLVRVMKSLMTEEIAQQDRLRDRSFAAFKSAVKNATYSDDPDVVRCAVALTILLDTYGNIAREDLDVESASIDKLITDLEGTTYRPMVEGAGIWQNVMRLKADNNTFKAMFSKRTDDTIAKDATDTRELRNKVNEQYALLCDYVVLKARMKDEVQYNQSVDIINTIRNQYNTMKARSKAATKEDDQPAKS